MKKHIIFTGRRCTGKSLFAKLIFDSQTTLFVDGRFFRNDHHSYASDREKWDYKNVVVDDLRPSIEIESLYSNIFHDTMIIDRQGREVEIVKTPRHIFVLNSIPVETSITATFKRRFHVFDFDKDPISDLMKIIHDEKIIIKTL